MIEMNCPKCGASLELNLDKLMAFCPYCGQKLSFDSETLRKILVEREKTKQTNISESQKTKRKIVEANETVSQDVIELKKYKMQLDHEKEMEKYRDKYLFKIFGAMGIVALIIFLIVAIAEHFGW